ncbi:hypothetical protein GC173_04530 [bacterium]|nr:hypothetical protein [bacterium]
MIARSFVVPLTLIAGAAAAGEPAAPVVAVTADSRFAVVTQTAGRLKDRTRIQIVDVRKEAPIADYEADLRDVRAVAPMIRSSYFSAGLGDGTVTVSKLADGTPLRSWKAHDGPIILAQSNYGLGDLSSTDILTTVGADGHVRRWRSHSENRLVDFDLCFEPHQAVIAGGEFLATLTDEGTISFFELDTGRRRGPLPESGGPWVELISASERLILLGRKPDGTIKGWRGEKLTPFSVGEASWGNLTSMAVLSRGQELILLRADNRLVFIDLPTGVEVDRWREDTPLRALLPAPDPRWLLLVEDRDISIISPASEDRQKNLDTDSGPEILLF